MTRVFKGVFMVLITGEQGCYKIDKRSTLRNPTCDLYGLGNQSAAEMEHAVAAITPFHYISGDTLARFLV